MRGILLKQLLIFALIVVSWSGVISRSGGVRVSFAEPDPSVERLKAYFNGKGYRTDHLFSDPRFTVHAGIDSFFRKSAESAKVDERLRAQRRGDHAEAERIFREEYEKYKLLVKFDAKRDSLPVFLQTHAEQLSRCERKYGIPREVLAAVIGIESGFGRHRGAFYAFNVYVSMYLKNYRRSFAVSQLSELLAFCRRTGKDMFDLSSSYAGAIGFMQFIPYSLNHWFVGNDVYDMNDAIASTANYLSHFKKRRGSIEKALYAYNPSRYYVTFVLELADAGKDRL
ncbi:MAG: lytic murein transglycosylase [Candidatus Latescibacterota bacterium]